MAIWGLQIYLSYIFLSDMILEVVIVQFYYEEDSLLYHAVLPEN